MLYWKQALDEYTRLFPDMQSSISSRWWPMVEAKLADKWDYDREAVERQRRRAEYAGKYGQSAEEAEEAAAEEERWKREAENQAPRLPFPDQQVQSKAMECEPEGDRNLTQLFK
jgi:hypothetical protein